MLTARLTLHTSFLPHPPPPSAPPPFLIACLLSPSLLPRHMVYRGVSTQFPLIKIIGILIWQLTLSVLLFLHCFFPAHFSQFHLPEKYNAQKKVMNKTSLRKMSKSGKSAYFHHVFANKVFWYIFLKLFQCIWSQREILHFFYIFFNLKQFFRSYYYFFQTLKLNTQKRHQKSRKLDLKTK